MTQNNTNTNAFLIHFSAFAGFIFPFGQIITPLIAWQTLKNRTPYLNEQGKEAINFNISYTLYTFALSIFTGVLFTGNMFNHFDFNLSSNSFVETLSIGSITGFFYLIRIALIFIASFKAKEEENYTYPFSIKFIQ